jgi:cobalt-zinc-cadmium efflux system protein
VSEHAHAHPASERRLALAFGLSLGLLAVEVVAGLAAHSLALLADAGHILTDAFAFAVAWFAVLQARRPADLRRTYGYQRVEVLAAMANGALLVIVVVAIAYEAARRLQSPPQVHAPVVLGAALVAIAVNVFLARNLRHPHMDLNERAALLHVLGDLAASVAVLVAGAVILLTGWVYADPLLSLLIAAIIAWNAGGIVRETLNILLEGAPRGLDLDAVTRAVESEPGVESVHDLHVWSLASRQLAFSCHAVLEEQGLDEAEHLVRRIETRLCDSYGIAHTTIQVEMCHPCVESGHAPHQHNHPHLPVP